MSHMKYIYILPGPWTPKGPPVGRLAVPRAPRKTSRCEPKERKGQVTGDHCGGVSHGCHGLLVYGIYIYMGQPWITPVGGLAEWAYFMLLYTQLRAVG